MRVEKYQQNRKSEWDAFVKQAKNGHFLFQRDFMEYHADRFVDYSLMCYNDKEQLIALLPANLKNDILFSHQGLTFGGFIIHQQISTKVMLQLFDVLIKHLKSENIAELIYKCIPAIYHKKPAEEDLYALFINHAQLIRRDISSVIPLTEIVSYSKSRKWGINKAKNSAIEITEQSDYAHFWTLLKSVLKNNHQIEPVHSLEEISQLAKKFPHNIRLFLAKKNQEILAGCVVFENDQVVHTQYLANSPEGRKLRALDLLIHHLVTVVYPNKKYFDFGISTEENGLSLNEGLITQKEEFGAYAIAHDFYELKIC